MNEKISERLEGIRQRVELIEFSLPKRNDPASVSLSAKIPFKALDYREALMWRFVELARHGFENFKSGAYCSAILLTRAAIETTAALWYLNRKIKSCIDIGELGDIDDNLMKLLMGSKVDSSMPNPVNVLTFVDKVDKDIPGFRSQYDELSEFSHPNWAGTLGLFSTLNRKKVWTDFGYHEAKVESPIQAGTINLDIALMLFEHSYNEISDMLPEFVRICELDLNAKSKDGI